MNRATVIVALYSALGVAAVAWGWWRGNRNIYEYGDRNLVMLAVSPFVGLAFGLAMVFLSRLAVHSMEWARVLHREFHAVVHELSSKEIFLLAASSSVGEELFFRAPCCPRSGCGRRAPCSRSCTCARSADFCRGRSCRSSWASP